MKTGAHQKKLWTDLDHLVAVYLYLYGTEGLGRTMQEIASMLGRSHQTILQRFENYRYAQTDGSEGLPGWDPAKIKHTFESFACLSRADHRTEVLKALKIEDRHVFRPKARTIVVLGQELISDETVAILELVKNGYDADAEKVTIEIDAGPSGFIKVADDGFGMSEFDMLHKWLEPATAHKGQRVDGLKQRTPKGRVPSGEKGLGRFSTHRLGSYVQVVSRTANDSMESVLEVDWTQYEDPNTYLDEVENRFYRRDTQSVDSKSGTILYITGLRSAWAASQTDLLKDALVRLLDPFSVNGFQIELLINGRPENLNEYFMSILEDASDVLDVTVDATGVFDGTLNDKPIRGNVDGHLTTARQAIARSCGGFQLKLYVYDFGQRRRNLTGRETLVLEVKAKVEGVAVYRDDIRVLPYGLPGQDWLHLDNMAISDLGSRIRNKQLFGVASITHDGNPALLDKTSREGLLQNDAYEGFVLRLQRLVKEVEIQRIQRKSDMKKVKAVDPVQPLLKDLRREPNITVQVKEKIERVQVAYNQERDRTENQIHTMSSLAGMGLAAERITHELAHAIRTLRSIFYRMRRAIPPDSSVLDLVRDGDAATGIIERELQGLNPFWYAKRSTMHSIDMKGMVERASTFFVNLFAKENIMFEVIEVQPLIVEENEGVVIQVLINLLDNAAYWLRTVSDRERKISVRIDGTTRELLITDNGPGIKPEDRAYIFDPFFSRKPDGRGLGLYIVRDMLARRHHSIESLADDLATKPGATFKVTFA